MELTIDKNREKEGSVMITSRPIKIIVERIVVCEDVRNSFSKDGNKKMETLYRGKIAGFKESLEYLGLDYDQIDYLAEIEREKIERGCNKWALKPIR